MLACDGPAVAVVGREEADRVARGTAALRVLGDGPQLRLEVRRRQRVATLSVDDAQDVEVVERHDDDVGARVRVWDVDERVGRDLREARDAKDPAGEPEALRSTCVSFASNSGGRDAKQRRRRRSGATSARPSGWAASRGKEHSPRVLVHVKRTCTGRVGEDLLPALRSRVSTLGRLQDRRALKRTGRCEP